MKTIKKIALFLGIMSLNACGISSGTIPSDHYYRLPAIETETATTQASAIVVKPVRVDGLYHERAMLYVDENQPLELKRYHYHYWVETPASLIQKYLDAYFVKTGLTNDQTKLKSARVEIRPNLLNFERLISNGKAEAYVRLHVDIQSNGESAKTFAKTYEAKVEAASMSMHDTVSAFGSALDEIAKAVVSELASF